MTRLAKRPPSPVSEDDLVVLSNTCRCLHLECKNQSQTIYVSSLYRKKHTSKTDGKHVPPVRSFLYLKTDQVKTLSQETVMIFQRQLCQVQEDCKASRKLNTDIFSSTIPYQGKGWQLLPYLGDILSICIWIFQYMKLLRVCNFGFRENAEDRNQEEKPTDFKSL